MFNNYKSEEGENMKNIYDFYCLFLIGNLLPLLLIEFYFQNYYTMGLIAITGIIVLTICTSIKYLKIKSIKQYNKTFEKINYVNLLQNQETNKRPSFYFFRKNFL